MVVNTMVEPPQSPLDTASDMGLPAVPAALVTTDGWRRVGRGTLTWSAFRLYDAYLYAIDDAFYPNGRFALELAYLRSMPAHQIVAASSMEMERLAFPAADVLAEWTAALEAFIPDMESGDRLVGVFDGSAGVRFFYNDEFCGEIASAQFARAFAAIWLDERSRSAALRASLFGIRGDTDRQ
jgi:hypothetical protein